MNVYRAVVIASKSMFSSRAVKVSSLSVAGGLFLMGPTAANELPVLSDEQAAAGSSAQVESTPEASLPVPGGPVLNTNTAEYGSGYVSALGSIGYGAPLPLSPGDRLQVTIPGVGGEEFSGVYEVNLNGDLEVPYIPPLRAAGFVPEALEQQLGSKLVERQLFRPELLQLSVQVLDYSPIQVSVTGAVFSPGRLLVSQESAAAGTTNINNDSTQFPGDYPVERYLTSTLLSAGGVQPTADISQVQILRGTQSTVVDLSGIITGDSVDDFPLIAGDQVIVPNKGVFQGTLVRPTQITPDTVQLYVSNITEPGNGRNLEGDGDINAASFEYGTNLVQALVAARCVGGTRSTNANRRAVLIQTDTVSGELNTSEYLVQDLITQATENPNDTPLLMPNDAIACYDSGVVNARSLFDTVGDFLNPLNLLRSIFR